MSTIPDNKIPEIENLYYNCKMSTKDISRQLAVSQNSVFYFMRKHKLPRRSFSEAHGVTFAKKKPSFKIKKNLSSSNRELKVIGAMLYWGEGYKSSKSKTVDFANSDPDMVSLFVKFLRSTYDLNEKKFRILLYCYADQNVGQLIKFWSRLTKIPKSQFTKPYVREDFKKNSRKMEYGLVHIRYNDKKLLLEIKNLIESYKNKFA